MAPYTSYSNQYMIATLDMSIFMSTTYIPLELLMPKICQVQKKVSKETLRVQTDLNESFAYVSIC